MRWRNARWVRSGQNGAGRRVDKGAAVLSPPANSLVRRAHASPLPAARTEKSRGAAGSTRGHGAVVFERQEASSRPRLCPPYALFLARRLASRLRAERFGAARLL